MKKRPFIKSKVKKGPFTTITHFHMTKIQDVGPGPN